MRTPTKAAMRVRTAKNNAAFVERVAVDALPAFSDYVATLGKTQRELAPLLGTNQSGVQRMFVAGRASRDLRVLVSEKGHLEVFEIKRVAKGRVSVYPKRSRARNDGVAPV